jgi:hypothetical protein
MKTETPITDSCVYHIGGFAHPMNAEVAPAEKMRELERENEHLRSVVRGIRFVAYQSAEVRAAIDDLSNVGHHPRQLGNEAGNKSNL